MSFRNSVFRIMIKKCLDEDVKYFAVRFKLQVLSDLKSEEIDLRIEKLSTRNDESGFKI